MIEDADSELWDLSESPKQESNNSEIIEKEAVDKNLKPSSFEIMRLLGAGSFGLVCLVKNKINGELMAMKVIDKWLIKEKNMVDYAFLEKNIMIDFDHPFIIKLKHSFQTPEK